MRGGRTAGSVSRGLLGIAAFIPMTVVLSLACSPVVSWLDPGLDDTENGVESHAIALGLTLTVMAYAVVGAVAVARASTVQRVDADPTAGRRHAVVAVVVLMGLGLLTLASAAL